MIGARKCLLATLMIVIILVGTYSYSTGQTLVEGYDISASTRGTPLKEVFADQFKIGVGLYGSSIQTDSLNHGAIAEIIKYHFNSTTYTNLMKPGYILDQARSIRNYQTGILEPAVKFDSVIKGLEFCQENNIQMRGHVLVWHAQTPEWFFREGYMTTGEYVDRETMLFRLESYIKQVLEFVQTEYPGVIYAWDVVNEAIDNVPGNYETQSGFSIRTKHGDDNRDNPWYKILGVEYVEKAFEYARKYASPDVKLFYNDYNTFQPARREAIYRLATHLKEKGLIDGIGMQSYIGLDYPGLDSGTDNYKAALTRFGELDLELHITELSIGADGTTDAQYQRQADRYGDVFKIYAEINKGIANITSVTLFGLMDHYILYDDDTQTSRLFDGNLQPKPVFYQIVDPYKPWHVNKALYEGAAKLIDKEGNVILSMLPGEYEMKSLPLENLRQVWLSKGYVLELLGDLATERDFGLYIGDDQYLEYRDLKLGEKIEIRENTAENLLVGKKIKASHREDRAIRAIDGALITSWSVNENPPYWLSVDLGEPYILTGWVVYHRGGGGIAQQPIDGPVNTKDFSLQISEDGEEWQDVDVVEDNVLAVTHRALKPIKARYVRLLITQPTSLGFNQEAVIYEFEVHGLK